VWRHHWDFQLYKALEVQFRAGLENINKSLPEVNCPLCKRRHVMPAESMQHALQCANHFASCQHTAYSTASLL
jgi:hypothetical protein